MKKLLQLTGVFIITYFNMQAQDVDLSFGVNGVVTTNIGTNDRLYDMVTLPNQNIIVVGSTESGASNDLILLQYLPQGTLDSSFGTNGIVQSQFGGDEIPQAIAIQEDGKIVVASNFNNTQLLLVRYLSNGIIDTTFGEGEGFIRTNALVNIADVKIQSDGKILVAASNDSFFKAMRFHSDGRIDMDFGTEGLAVYDFDSPDRETRRPPIARANSLELGAETFYITGTKIGVGLSVVVPNFAITQFDFNGTAITGNIFGNGSIVATNSTFHTERGELIISGTNKFPEDTAVSLKLDKNLTIQDNFADEGFARKEFENNALFTDILFDNKILLSGILNTGDQASLVLVQSNTNGIQDSNFGLDGVFQIDDELRNFKFDTRIASQSQNKTLIASTYSNNDESDTHIILMRFDNGHILSTNPLNSIDSTFKVFPNPTRNQITVNYKIDHTEEMTVALSDIQGRTIKKLVHKKLQHTGIHKITSDITAIPMGIYMVTITGKNRKRQKTMQLVKY